MSIDVARLAGPLGEFMAQISGKNGDKRFEEFLLWLKRVGSVTLVLVNRTLTAEQAVNVTGRIWWYKNQVELDNAPVSGADRVEQEIFELNYEPTPTELDAEYTSRRLSADLATLSAYMVENPEAADDRPLACQWDLNLDGTAACAVFFLYGRGRTVDVRRDGNRWNRRYRFAGVRKS